MSMSYTVYGTIAVGAWWTLIRHVWRW